MYTLIKIHYVHIMHPLSASFLFKLPWVIYPWGTMTIKCLYYRPKLRADVFRSYQDLIQWSNLTSLSESERNIAEKEKIHTKNFDERERKPDHMVTQPTDVWSSSHTIHLYITFLRKEIRLVYRWWTHGKNHWPCTSMRARQPRDSTNRKKRGWGGGGGSQAQNNSC